MPDRGPKAKLRIYHTIYRLNISFANIFENCRTLGEFGILSPKFTRLYQSYVQELQAEINEDLMSAMDEVESCDQFRFGKARVAREKELRDPDDVFIHAEERRKELARQGKKPPPLKRNKHSALNRVLPAGRNGPHLTPLLDRCAKKNRRSKTLIKSVEVNS